MMTSGHLAAGRYRYRPASASSTSSTTSLASADSGTMFATLFNAIKAPFTTMTAASAPPTATSSSATSAAAAAAAASSKAASSHTGPASAPAPPLPCETILNSYEICMQAHANKRPRKYETEWCETEKQAYRSCRLDLVKRLAIASK